MSFEKLSYNKEGSLIGKYTIDHDGNYHGEFINFYDDGKTSLHGFYSNGQWHGEVRYYDSDGSCMSTTIFNNGMFFAYGEELSEVDKFELVLKHGMQFFKNEEC